MSFDIAKYPTLALAGTVQELRLLPKEKLPALCDELRQYLLDSVSRSSGHFASGLGVVEQSRCIMFTTPRLTIWCGTSAIRPIRTRS